MSLQHLSEAYKALTVVENRQIEEKLRNLIEEIYKLPIEWTSDEGVFLGAYRLSKGRPCCIAIHENYKGVEHTLTRTITLAHELGHHIDLIFTHHGNYKTFYQANEDDPIKFEQDAWENAILVLTGIGFNRWEEFYRRMEYSLSTYYQHHERSGLDVYMKEVRHD